MTILKHRTPTRIAGVAIGFAGLLIASAAVANHDGPQDIQDGDDDTAIRQDREPRFEDEGESLRAELELRGLNKNRRVRAELEATAEVEFQCRRHNKKFDRELEIELEGVEYYPRQQIHNARLDIEIETEDAEDALDAKYGPDGGCPNGWNRRIEEVSFLDAKLGVEQGPREVVTWLCTFDNPTRDGRIRRRDVDCQTLN